MNNQVSELEQKLEGNYYEIDSNYNYSGIYLFYDPVDYPVDDPVDDPELKPNLISYKIENNKLKKYADHIYRIRQTDNDLIINVFNKNFKITDKKGDKKNIYYFKIESEDGIVIEFKIMEKTV